MENFKQIITKQILSTIDYFKENHSKKLSRQTVWHGMKVEHAKTALTEKFLTPFTKHRYWEDGRRRRDNEKDYEDSFWMYGWSTTRDKNYAMNWGSVVLELDLDQIKTKFKVQQISWGFLLNSNKNRNFRKEVEEFIIAKKIPKSLQSIKDYCNNIDIRLDTLYDKKTQPNLSQNELSIIESEIEKLEKEEANWFTIWNTPQGNKINLDKCLKGIYLSLDCLEYIKKEEYEFFIKHPMFKGFYENKSSIQAKITI